MLLLALFSGSAVRAEQSQMAPLPDAELAGVWGQAMVAISNVSLNGLDFSRITLNADLKLSANFSNLRLGEYNYAARNGSGADIDITRLQFGRSDLIDAQRTVALSNPYFELVYAQAGNASQREIVGMRLGFEGVSGAFGLSAKNISGSLAIADGQSASVLDSRQDPLGGKRWDGGNCGAGACPFSLAQIGSLQAGDAAGPSRDLFLSVLRSAVQFPAAVAGMAAPDIAQAGIWMNWRDKLSAGNLNAVLPPNLPPVLPPLLTKPGGG
ncbi:hypothetical protein [Roseateles oligotrophus]|uniref:Pentapeptide repeat-containing protein n=1 Tax=Roseateles oligotrophus TaxID=1769250 RepID=A0ABT2YDI7_9BURK|nr:hypothetical protein [Roseateles oligotrophus]MCV2368121.1 hypothetical protein [Roseateles oligotrophus]